MVTKPHCSGDETPRLIGLSGSKNYLIFENLSQNFFKSKHINEYNDVSTTISREDSSVVTTSHPNNDSQQNCSLNIKKENLCADYSNVNHYFYDNTKTSDTNGPIYSDYNAHNSRNNCSAGRHVGYSYGKSARGNRGYGTLNGDKQLRFMQPKIYSHPYFCYEYKLARESNNYTNLLDSSVTPLLSTNTNAIRSCDVNCVNCENSNRLNMNVDRQNKLNSNMSTFSVQDNNNGSSDLCRLNKFVDSCFDSQSSVTNLLLNSRCINQNKLLACLVEKKLNRLLSSSVVEPAVPVNSSASSGDSNEDRVNSALSSTEHSKCLDASNDFMKSNDDTSLMLSNQSSRNTMVDFQAVSDILHYCYSVKLPECSNLAELVHVESRVGDVNKLQPSAEADMATTSLTNRVYPNLNDRYVAVSSLDILSSLQSLFYFGQVSEFNAYKQICARLCDYFPKMMSLPTLYKNTEKVLFMLRNVLKRTSQKLDNRLLFQSDKDYLAYSQTVTTRWKNLELILPVYSNKCTLQVNKKRIRSVDSPDCPSKSCQKPLNYSSSESCRNNNHTNKQIDIYPLDEMAGDFCKLFQPNFLSRIHSLQVADSSELQPHMLHTRTAVIHKCPEFLVSAIAQVFISMLPQYLLGSPVNLCTRNISRCCVRRYFNKNNSSKSPVTVSWQERIEALIGCSTKHDEQMLNKLYNALEIFSHLINSPISRMLAEWYTNNTFKTTISTELYNQDNKKAGLQFKGAPTNHVKILLSTLSVKFPSKLNTISFNCNSLSTNELRLVHEKKSEFEVDPIFNNSDIVSMKVIRSLDNNMARILFSDDVNACYKVSSSKH